MEFVDTLGGIVIVVVLDIVAVFLVLSNRDNEIALAMISLVLGFVCYSLSWIDEQGWVSENLLVYGISCPFILIITAAVVLIYWKALQNMKLAVSLKHKKKDRNKVSKKNS